MTRVMFIVWNPAKTEGFVTDNERDAHAVAGRRKIKDKARGYVYEVTAGKAFADAYDDDKLTVEKVTLP